MTEADKAWLAEERQARVWALIQREFPDREPTLDGLITYDLGLDSFGWMNLSLAIETETGITLTLADISRIATLRDLLTVVLERRAAKPEAVRSSSNCANNTSIKPSCVNCSRNSHTVFSSGTVSPGRKPKNAMNEMRSRT